MNNPESSQSHVRQQVSHDEVARRAAELWRQYGTPQGRDEEIWLEAERQLRGIPANLDSPASEGVGASQSGGENPASMAQDKAKARNAEMMEPKRSSPVKGGRGKNKSSGK